RLWYRPQIHTVGKYSFSHFNRVVGRNGGDPHRFGAMELSILNNFSYFPTAYIKETVSFKSKLFLPFISNNLTHIGLRKACWQCKWNKPRTFSNCLDSLIDFCIG